LGTLDPDLLRLTGGAAAIALFHAILPTHWLPFALVGRAQRWPLARRAGVSALAALGHATVTGIVGLLAALAGRGIGERLHAAERAGGAVLLGFGAAYILVDLRHLGHRHLHHAHGGEIHDRTHHRLAEGAAILSLVLMLSVSPCVALVPIFFEAGAASLRSAGAVAAVNAIVTVPTMALMVSLASIGLERIMERIERYERALVGGLLLALGVAALVLGHEH
jgi:cytochrome c biogenesis protein CcdA